MAKVDMQKVRAKVAEEAAKKNRSFDKVRRLKLKTGENQLRLLPPWTEEGTNANQFWTETYTHWSIGNGGYDEENGRRFTCPVKTPGGPGGPCEVCDLNASLRNSQDPSDVELGKQIYARRQFNSNVVNLKDPTIKQADVDEWVEAHPDKTEEDCPFAVGDTKVQLWSYPATVYKDIMDVFSDGIDLSDLDEGHNIIVTKEGAGLATQYRVRINTKPSAFEFVGDLDTAMYNLDSLIKFPEPGDMQKALNGELTRQGSLPEAPKAVPQLPARKAAKAAPVVEEVDEVEEVEDEEPPPCFKDPKVHSATDPQCAGGTDEDGNEYDACPHFEPCAEAVAELVAPPTRRKPTPKAAPAKSVPAKGKSSVADIEAKLNAALKG